MILSLNYYKDYPHLGYGTFGANLHKGLERLGVELVVNGGLEDMRYPTEGVKACVVAGLPGTLYGKYEGQLAVLFSMWEADTLPPTFSAHLHNYDLVIVPNSHNVAVFSEHHPNVAKVPLGYDSTVWMKMDRPEPIRRFRFLFCGAGAAKGSRKGSDVAVDGFLKAFPRWERMDPQPQLVVKTLKAAPDPQPFIEFHQGEWPLIKLVDLYRSCHAMVLPSRGEGWGYHPQQAVATGIPAIVSDIPGHLEYSHLPGFAHIPVVQRKAEQFAFGDAGEWWEPDLDATVEAYRSVYDHYGRWSADARSGAGRMRREYDHVAMARRTVLAVGEGNMVRCETGGWIPATEMEYRAVVNRYVDGSECSINGVRYTFHPDREYWVAANLWTVLGDSGKLANGDERVGRLPVH